MAKSDYDPGEITIDGPHEVDTALDLIEEYVTQTGEMYWGGIKMYIPFHLQFTGQHYWGPPKIVTKVIRWAYCGMTVSPESADKTGKRDITCSALNETGEGYFPTREGWEDTHLSATYDREQWRKAVHRFFNQSDFEDYSRHDPVTCSCVPLSYEQVQDRKEEDETIQAIENLIEGDDDREV